MSHGERFMENRGRQSNPDERALEKTIWARVAPSC